ncbi:MAG: hypothetical protein V2A70_03185, partial [Candidatus Omnitrophota bacterium]
MFDSKPFSDVTRTLCRKHSLNRLIVFSRACILLPLYLIIFGLPIGAGFLMLGFGKWIFPVLLMAFLATIGPFIYFFFRRHAQERLWAERKRYQQVLRQASAGMWHIRELDQLYKLIVNMLTRTVMMESAVIYALDEVKGVYTRMALCQRQEKKHDFQEFKQDSLLATALLKFKGRFSIDEIRWCPVSAKTGDQSQIEALLASMDASL